MLASKWLNFTRSCVGWTSVRSKNPEISQKLYPNFENYVAKIVENALADKSFIDSVEIRERLHKISLYDTCIRDPQYGKMTLFAYESLVNPESVNDEKLHQIKVLAWALELVQSYFIIIDDAEDNATTRFGKPCWHTLPDVGPLAINDSGLLRNLIFEILRQNICEELFPIVSHYFNKAELQLHIGVHMDVTLSRSKDYNKFTVEQYNTLAKYKSSFYTAQFPMLLALSLCNKANVESYRNVENVCSNLGILLQVQNDFEDYYIHEPDNKTNTDIQNGRCSWPAVKFLQHCNESQRREFEECYGSWEPEKVKRVRLLFKEINLPKFYYEEERARNDAVLNQIVQLPKGAVPSPQVFHKYIETMRHHIGNVKILSQV